MQEVAESILLFAYFWYNFMPLARGTAAVGYTTILALFLAAGMPVVSPIPEDEQTDWEAILAQDARSFIRATGEAWLFPAPLRDGGERSAVEEVRS